MSQFPNLSLYNLLLIYYQYPEATLIAGENAWKDNYNLEIREDAKAICLVRPALDKDEVLGYEKIGVFDVSQLVKRPEIKKERYSVSTFIYNTTGYIWQVDGDLLEGEYMLFDNIIGLGVLTRGTEEEINAHADRLLLSVYMEVFSHLSKEDPKEYAMYQAIEYMITKRYGYEVPQLNEGLISNMRQYGLEFFVELSERFIEIVNEVENADYMEFNFAETALVDLLIEAKLEERVEDLLEYAIDYDDTMLNKTRETFVEKIEMLPPKDKHKIIEDRNNNKMLTQPPYKIKLIPEM
jgi:hypothetical protein